MKALLTGSTGFIGRRFLEVLVNDDRYEKVFITVRQTLPKDDLYSHDKVQTVCLQEEGSLKAATDECDEVYHLAALFSTVDSEPIHESLVKDNLLLSTKIFDAVEHSSSSPVLVAASTYSMLSANGDVEPHNFYETTKYMVELLARSYTMPVAFLRPPDTYGPNDTRPKVHNLVRNAVLNDEECFSFRKPEQQQICLMHVDDVVRAFMHTAERLRAFESQPHCLDRTYEVYDLLHDSNVLTFGELASILTRDSATGAAFPGDDETTPLPLSDRSLPDFEPMHYPQRSLRDALFSGVTKP